MCTSPNLSIPECARSLQGILTTIAGSAVPGFQLKEDRLRSAASGDLQGSPWTMLETCSSLIGRSEESTSLTQSSVFRIRDGRIQLIGVGGYDYGLSGDKWR